MEDLRLQFAAGLGLLAGPVFFARGFRDLRVRRLLQNTPTSRIRSMAMGLVEVCGRAESRSRVTAPFSGRDCVFWHVEIATRTGKRGWSTVHRNDSGNPFFLRDDTGVALVYPRGADCKIHFGVEEECLGVSLPSIYAEYMKEHCGPSSGLWRLGSLRFRERVLEAGQQIYLLGSAMPRSTAVAVSEPDEAAATGTGDWAARRIRPIQEEVTAVIRRGENERTFIISQDSESTLTLTYGAKALLEIAGGPAATLFGLCYWLDYLRRMAS